MSFLRNTTRRGAANKRGISGAQEAAARFGQATPTMSPIFRDNRCAQCDDGRKPCKQGGAHHCSNPTARNH